MKYKLTEETISFFGKILHRIECVTEFAEIAVGDKGGFVESLINLSSCGDAWVYGNARVYGNAQVHDTARVGGKARVGGNAQVGGNARVCGNAQVGGNARVCGDALVYGKARVYGKAQVCGKAQVYGKARVYGKAQVHDNAQVGGNARVCGKARVINITFLDHYQITITDNHILIGCEQHTISEWENFDDQTIFKMDSGALEWWVKHKNFIFMAIEFRK